MTNNPYEPPKSIVGSADPSVPRNLVGMIGFAVSGTGMVALFSSSLSASIAPHSPLTRLVTVIGVCLTFACVPGFLISLVGAMKTPRRAAIWGILLGGLGSFYVPTMIVSLLQILRR